MRRSAYLQNSEEETPCEVETWKAENIMTQNRQTNKQTNSVALVRERTIPTERPPPVGEVSANVCGYRGVTWSAQRIPTAVNLCFLDRNRYFFIQVAPQLNNQDLSR